MKSKIFSLLSAAVLVLALGSLAKADSITDSNVLVTGTVTGTTATLTFECLDPSCVGWYLGDVTLKGFTFTGTPTLNTAPAGYSVLNGGQNNSNVGNGGGCNTTQPDKAVCFDAALPLTTQLVLFDPTNPTTAANTTLTFVANLPNGDGLSSGTLHFQATAYNSADATSGTKVWAPSDDLNGGTTSVPEPGTLALFGTGALGLAGFLRRKLFA